MQNRLLLLLFGSLLTVSCGFSVASAQPTTPFAITATNVTMPMTGDGVSEYTVTGIPGDGVIQFNCAYSGPATVARIPLCPMTPPVELQVTAGETLTGQIEFYPYGSVIAASLRSTPRRSNHLPAAGMAVACAFLLGFGLRRRARRWLAMLVFAAGTLAGVGGISGCINGPPMTPGTYQYTIMASWSSTTPAILSSQTTTTISVTVP
jgi:hypothetical protein